MHTYSRTEFYNGLICVAECTVNTLHVYGEYGTVTVIVDAKLRANDDISTF